MHISEHAYNPQTSLYAHLAFERLHVRVDDHVCLERLFLHEALVAEVTLVGTNVGVDQHMSLHVGQQSELPPTNTTLVLLHTLQREESQDFVVSRKQASMELQALFSSLPHNPQRAQSRSK